MTVKPSSSTSNSRGSLRRPDSASSSKSRGINRSPNSANSASTTGKSQTATPNPVRSSQKNLTTRSTSKRALESKDTLGRSSPGFPSPARGRQRKPSSALLPFKPLLPEVPKRPEKLSNSNLALLQACSCDDIDGVYNLLWKDANANCKMPIFGTSPLSIAFRRGHLEISHVLFSFGASLESDDYGATPVHWAANHGRDVLLSHMLKRGHISMEDLRKQDRYGSTALHFAAVKNLESTVRILVSAGIDPFMTNNDGKKASDLTTDDNIKQILIDAEAAATLTKQSKRPGRESISEQRPATKSRENLKRGKSKSQNLSSKSIVSASGSKDTLKSREGSRKNRSKGDGSVKSKTRGTNSWIYK
ncbi:hypothetical protein HDU76_013492 [Blyttiomyces sp. JEL0837]|nr:hypothetical protein HDU76_013492 [Blyttiomyces sp. JEL0837]